MADSHSHSPEGPPSWTLFNRRRLAVLSVLADGEPSIDFDRLAGEVAERSVAASGSGTADLDEVRSILYHVDLPKLGDAGYLVFEPHRGTVTAMTSPRSLRNLLRSVRMVESWVPSGSSGRNGWPDDGDG